MNIVEVVDMRFMQSFLLDPYLCFDGLSACQERHRSFPLTWCIAKPLFPHVFFKENSGLEPSQSSCMQPFPSTSFSDRDPRVHCAAPTSAHANSRLRLLIARALCGEPKTATPRLRSNLKPHFTSRQPEQLPEHNSHGTMQYLAQKNYAQSAAVEGASRRRL